MRDHAADAAVRIGFPVVVKVDAAAASHKSDVGGVAIDLPDAGAVRAAVRGMQARLAGLGPLRFLVQQFVADGQELIVGASRSGDLGHMVMFGLGGIHVEVLKDVVFRLGPVSAPEAEAMLASIRGAALLDGVRGRPALCKPALVELIQRVSMLMTQLPRSRSSISIRCWRLPIASAPSMRGSGSARRRSAGNTPAFPSRRPLRIRTIERWPAPWRRADRPATPAPPHWRARGRA